MSHTLGQIFVKFEGSRPSTTAFGESVLLKRQWAVCRKERIGYTVLSRHATEAAAIAKATK